jgi:hypothetical protein
VVDDVVLGILHAQSGVALLGRLLDREAPTVASSGGDLDNHRAARAFDDMHLARDVVDRDLRTLEHVATGRDSVLAFGQGPAAREEQETGCERCGSGDETSHGAILRESVGGGMPA